MNKKIIHYIFEICLFIVCISIGRFEDLFILPAFYAATVYNVIYVLLLRRLTGERFLASVCNIVLIWAIGLSAIYIIYAIFIFFAGYTWHGLFGGEIGNTYYGIDAWKNNLFIIFFAPVTLVNVIYIAVYYLVKKKRSKK